MRLTRSEIASTAWQRIRKHIEGRIEDLRKQNDGALDEIETARLRGRIAEMKLLLSIEDEDSPAHEIAPELEEHGG